MDIDSTLSLAFTIEANPGSYALLLGAGVSYGAVPTTWEILTALVKQLAAVQGASPEDPMEWHKVTYSSAPNYSEVLSALSPLAAGRVGLLKPFFEGSPETEGSAEVDAPQPTAGHHAIARIMKAGFIKVVVTTNFDRLLEQALATIGVAPVVLSTPSEMAGALPLHLQTACIIKIHGDYLDPSFLNTGDELEAYDPAVSALVARVLDDYGLVVCGWSANYDIALRHELQAHNPQRYQNYWVEPSNLSAIALQLAQHRKARVITANSSDFFTELDRSISSIRNTNRSHPNSIAVGVANTKRFITTRNRIELHDQVARAFDAARQQVGLDAIGLAAKCNWNDGVAFVDNTMCLSLALVATVSQWGSADEDNLWTSRLMEMSSPPPVSPQELWNLLYYPATLVLYTAGVGMVIAGRLATLETLLRRSISIPPANNPGLLGSELSALRSLSCLHSEKTASMHIYDVIARLFREQLLESDDTVRMAFERLELLMALVAFDAQVNSDVDVRYVSAGIIRRVGNFFAGSARPISEMEQLRVDGVHPWTALGLFGGDQQRLQQLLDRFNSTFFTNATNLANRQ